MMRRDVVFSARRRAYDTHGYFAVFADLVRNHIVDGCIFDDIVGGIGIESALHSSILTRAYRGGPIQAQAAHSASQLISH